MSFLNWHSGASKTPAQDHHFRIAQYRSFAAKMPMLLACLVGSSLIEFFMLDDLDPVSAAGATEVGICLIALVTAIWWVRHGEDEIDRDGAMRRMMYSMMICVVGGFISIVNDILIYLASDQGMRLYLAFSIFGVGICCFVCTMHIRVMSLIVICLTTLPCTWMFVELGLPGGTAAGSLALIMACTMVVSMFSYQHDFKKLIATRVEAEFLAAENIRLASVDELTGLPNRRYFIQQCRSRTANGATDSTALAIGIIDIDGFRSINEHHGHQIGDIVLKEAVKRIESAVPANSTVCRIGGDEFALLIFDPIVPKALLQIGTSLKAAFEQPVAAGDIRAAIGCSVGFACYPKHSRYVETVFELAEYALRHGDGEGSGRCTIFNEDLERLRASEASLERALRRAVSLGRLFPVYQPITRSTTGDIIAFECLCRWTDPQLGAVPPDIFIRLAEKLGLIQTLTKQILACTLVNMQHWPHEMKVSINISATDVADRAFMEELLCLIGESSISPSRLIFEITETAVLSDFAGSRRQLDLARRSGIEIALDDFGTGFSSMSHLHQLPLDKVKIDRRFITDLCDNVASRNIVSGIVSLCDNLGVACVAEGVEHAAQLQILTDLGCTYSQGYHISRPVPADEVPKLIAALP
ncbi:MULTISPECIES: putative bifunctional diguanylate cyclase/phosphodiesterase [Xanthomonas]|uniref:putative bifunctional diguanylate cyclase/phosphodiesterase n=1 Tax=Xanthomonas TaxID=338 RepID=UPI001ADBC85E|nr:MULTISPECIES: EAL domain-containing protein [unclassified Xanthomonas]MBO9873966.1 EAL domain-containing protein [Xanthomonas sp. D-93]WNH43820.1 EAL domain-containing protein [Xanthomonas sp. A6251]